LPGDTGSSGNEGQRGDIGSPGQQGVQGRQGPVGPVGQPGSKGSQGDRGGSGIAGNLISRLNTSFLWLVFNITFLQMPVTSRCLVRPEALTGDDGFLFCSQVNYSTDVFCVKLHLQHSA